MAAKPAMMPIVTLRNSMRQVGRFWRKAAASLRFVRRRVILYANVVPAPGYEPEHRLPPRGIPGRYSLRQ